MAEIIKDMKQANDAFGPATQSRWTRSRVWAVALLATAIYFSVALWLKNTYQPPQPPAGVAGEKFPLFYVFKKLQNSDSAYVGRVSNLSLLNALADSVDDNTRSPILLYENDRLLGPAHSLHDDIVKLGHGRYSHWIYTGFVLSASDNSDPNTNGRTYWAVLPPK